MTFLGEIFGLFILVIAAIETAIALSIILAYYRITNTNIKVNANIEPFLSIMLIFPSYFSITGLFNLFMIILIWFIIIKSIRIFPPLFWYGIARLIEELHALKYNDKIFEYETDIRSYKVNDSWIQDNIPVILLTCGETHEQYYYRNINHL